MRPLKFFSLLAVCFLLAACDDLPWQGPPKYDVTGSWALELSFPDKGITKISFVNDLVLKQLGNDITGTGINGGDLHGTISRSTVKLTNTLKAESGASVDVVFKGRLVDANTMKGTVPFPGYGKGEWTARRRLQ